LEMKGRSASRAYRFTRGKKKTPGADLVEDWASLMLGVEIM
jgi:hypothetical protein